MDEILSKIKKLLRLAEKSDFPAESANATAKAQALMMQHKISSAMLSLETEEGDVEEEIKDFETPLFHSGRKVARWRYSLAAVLCKANGCFCFQSGVKLKIVGKPTDAATVRALFEYCQAEIERLAQINCTGEGRVYFNNFRYGCVDAIREAIKREQKSAEKQIKETIKVESRALLVIDKALPYKTAKQAEKWATRKFRLVSGGGSSFRGNSNARNHGKQAGSSIYRGKRAGYLE